MPNPLIVQMENTCFQEKGQKLCSSCHLSSFGLVPLHSPSSDTAFQSLLRHAPSCHRTLDRPCLVDCCRLPPCPTPLPADSHSAVRSCIQCHSFRKVSLTPHWGQDPTLRAWRALWTSVNPLNLVQNVHIAMAIAVTTLQGPWGARMSDLFTPDSPAPHKPH